MCSDLISFIPWTSSSSSYALGKQFGVYPSVKTCEIFLCFVAIVRVRVMLTSLFFFCFTSLMSVTGFYTEDGPLFTPRDN